MISTKVHLSLNIDLCVKLICHTYTSCVSGKFWSFNREGNTKIQVQDLKVKHIVEAQGLFPMLVRLDTENSVSRMI